MDSMIGRGPLIREERRGSSKGCGCVIAVLIVGGLILMALVILALISGPAPVP